MSTAISEIEARIKLLSAAERDELLRTLIADIDGPADSDVERAWLDEAQRRYRELADGSVKGIPAEQVFENLKARLKR